MFRKILSVSSVLLISVNGHSWVFKVNGIEDARGGLQGNDLQKERYFCPSQNLATCQPDPKHGITLTQENLRPCRQVEQANKPHINAGDTLHVEWQGNGHANSQSDGTCVHLLWTNFEINPDFSSFNHFTGAECLPYHIGGTDTSATVTVPTGTASGTYTLMWYWPFGPFTYSSCMDFTVSGSSGNNPTETTTTTQAPVPTTTEGPNPPSWEFSLDVYNHFYDYLGCTIMPSGYCSVAFGSGHFCDSSNSDVCGRSTCNGIPLGKSCPFNSNNNPTTTPITTTTASPSTENSYKESGCSDMPDPHGFCKTHMGTTNTYCRSFQKDSCGRSICHGDTFSSLNPC